MMLRWLSVIGMAALPVVELKGAIPYAIGIGIAPWTAFLLALFGSCLPAPFILWLFTPVAQFARRKNVPVLKWIMDFAEGKAKRRQGDVTKYNNFVLLGLFVFVAIPLPTTGVWTGAIIATLLQLHWQKAIPAIVLGNIVAGFIVFALSGWVML